MKGYKELAGLLNRYLALRFISNTNRDKLCQIKTSPSASSVSA